MAASFLPLVGVCILLSQHHVLDFDSPRSLKLWRNWFASSRSEVSHGSMHTIDVVLDCWVGLFARSSFLPIRVCLLATCYLLEKMIEPMQGDLSII